MLERWRQANSPGLTSHSHGLTGKSQLLVEHCLKKQDGCLPRKNTEDLSSSPPPPAVLAPTWAHNKWDICCTRAFDYENSMNTNCLEKALLLPVLETHARTLRVCTWRLQESQTTYWLSVEHDCRHSWAGIYRFLTSHLFWMTSSCI